MGECQAPVHRKPKSLPGGTPAAAYRCWRVQNDETVINYPPVGGGGLSRFLSDDRLYPRQPVTQLVRR